MLLTREKAANLGHARDLPFLRQLRLDQPRCMYQFFPPIHLINPPHEGACLLTITSMWVGNILKPMGRRVPWQPRLVIRARIGAGGRDRVRPGGRDELKAL